MMRSKKLESVISIMYIIKETRATEIVVHAEGTGNGVTV